MLQLDTIAVLVPATWDVPGAGSIPTTPNKGFAEGRLEPAPADVSELVAAGMKLPAALFEAEGTNSAGGRVGVRVGVYDTGGADPLSLVQEAVARFTPAAEIEPTHLCTGRGLRTLQRLDHGPVAEGSVICDYWAGIKGGLGKQPTSFALLRFWSAGPANPDEVELFDDVAGSYLIGGGASFSGPLRLVTLRNHGPAGPEVAEPGRFRYAGWRLGTVYRSKMVNPKDVELLTEGGVRPRDGLLFLGVFFTWLAATLLLLGVGPVLLLGGVTAGGTMTQLRLRGVKAVVVLAVWLYGLLVFGVATS